MTIAIFLFNPTVLKSKIQNRTKNINIEFKYFNFKNTCMYKKNKQATYKGSPFIHINLLKFVSLFNNLYIHNVPLPHIWLKGLYPQ